MTRFLMACMASLALAGTAVAQAQEQGQTPANRPATASPRPDPRTIQMRGDRFKPLTYDEMTPEQKTMVDHLFAGPRAGAGGPFNVLLRSPEIGDLGQEFGASTRFKSSLPPRLYELAIIVTARHWTSQFEWQGHHRGAVQAGINQSIVDAIAVGKRPTFTKKDEEAVYNFCHELLETKQVSDATFAAAKQEFGERGVVDLITVTGWYSTVSMLLNVDRYPVDQPLLKPLK